MCPLWVSYIFSCKSIDSWGGILQSEWCGYCIFERYTLLWRDGKIHLCLFKAPIVGRSSLSCSWFVFTILESSIRSWCCHLWLFYENFIQHSEHQRQVWWIICALVGLKKLFSLNMEGCLITSQCMETIGGIVSKI